MKKWLMFISSYIPLYVVLVCKEIIIKFGKRYDAGKLFRFDDILLFNSFDDWSILGLILLSIVSIILLRNAVNNSKGLAVQDYEVIDIENKTASYYFDYVALYFLPCIGLSIGSIADSFVLVSIMLILGIVYISNDLMYINPVLTIFGYRVYSIELKPADSKSNVKISRIVITDCKEAERLIGEEVKMIVSDTKYTMILEKEQSDIIKYDR